MPVSMTAVHLRDLHKIAEHFNARPELLDEASMPSDQLSGGVRVLQFPDRGMVAREQWLQTCIPSREEYRFRAGEVRYLAQADQAFAVLVLSGDDCAKLLRALRDTRKLFANKIVVPFLSHSAPHDRALLLRRGADDVLHLGLSPQEGAVRLAALIRRQRWASSQQAEAELATERAAAAVAELQWLCPGPIGRQGRQVLAVLFAQFGKVVSRLSLSSAARTSSHWPSERQLHVIICSIRKHLRPPFLIETLRGEGFRLHMEAANDLPWPDDSATGAADVAARKAGGEPARRGARPAKSQQGRRRGEGRGPG